MIVNCASCAFFARKSESFGACRRHAPAPSFHPATGEKVAPWPTVRPAAWCGEWRPQSQEFDR